MLSTEVQRGVRLNKKKKSTNISPYPDEAIERLAWAFYPAILACWNSEEGQREFAVWQAEQAHHGKKEKQEAEEDVEVEESEATTDSETSQVQEDETEQ